MRLLALGVVYCLLFVITKAQQIKVNRLRIRSDIAYRYASTVVESQLENTHREAQEVTFKVRLPYRAFISNFSMTVDGETFIAKIREKKAAKKAYDKAKAAGKTTGHVAQATTTENEFQISINVGGNDIVVFNLMYQELLDRRLGAYEQRTYVDPGQIVTNFTIDVYIKESRDLTFIRVPPIQGENVNVISISQDNPLATVDRTASNAAHISFNPTVEDQRRASANGIQGQFVVQYDVDRASGVGEIHVADGYFVHYFAPPDLTATDKNVVFVLDTSGSMSGNKIKQMIEAMLAILSDLRPNDYFNIVQFNWMNKLFSEQTMVQATPENVQRAQRFVNGFSAGGGTRISNAVMGALDVLKKHRRDTHSQSPSLIFLLTDGQGSTPAAQVNENIRRKESSASIFTLGFGMGVNFNFLKEVALNNRGFARKIFEDADAVLQLKGFNDEVKSPLLSNINIKYLGKDIDIDSNVITETQFANYFNGSEIIVTGYLGPEPRGQLIAQVEGQSNTGRLVLDEEINLTDSSGDEITPTSSPPPTGNVGKFIERLWAFLTIKNMLDKELKTHNATEKAQIRQRALELSLKYSFVTPLTSLLVIKPDKQKPPASGAESGKGRGGARGRGGGSGGDPHFMIPIDGLERPICFDVTGTRGQILQLLHDSNLGLTSNARIASKSEKTKSTFFGEISLVGRGHTIIATPHSLTVDGDVYEWKNASGTAEKIHIGELVIDRSERDHIRITYRDAKVKILIARRLVPPTHPYKVDYLGFFVLRKKGFSNTTSGLIGQFQHLRIVKTGGAMHFPDSPSRKPYEAAILKKPNMARLRWEECYFAHNQGQGFILGRARDYLVSDLLTQKEAVAIDTP